MVTAKTVHAARKLMAEGMGLQGAAIRLGVLSSELDLALWTFIGVDLTSLDRPKRPEPMF